MTDHLDAAALTHDLVRTGSRWTSVEVTAETGSTNADLAGRARAGADLGAVLITDHQSAGRGRLGRTWTAPPGSGLAMSVLVRPAVRLAGWTWLPLLTGLAVAEAVRQVTDLPAVLKWPNDVLVAEKKLCGILAERVDTPSGPAAVVGMGINVHLRADQLPVPTATSVALALAELGAVAVQPNRTELAATVLLNLDRILTHWETVDSGAALALAYTERCSTLGRPVRVQLAGDRSVEGVAESVDAEGRLVVRTADGLQVFGAGDVTHVR